VQKWKAGIEAKVAVMQAPAVTKSNSVIERRRRSAQRIKDGLSKYLELIDKKNAFVFNRHQLPDVNRLNGPVFLQTVEGYIKNVNQDAAEDQVKKLAMMAVIR